MSEIIFNGPDGRLEGRFVQSEAKDAPIAMILHPLPQLGGDMNSPVTHRIYHLFAARGFSVLRFNFRGVGRSEGAFDNGIGELADATTALDWLQQLNPDAAQCWIAGYSFGAWIGMQLLMRRPEISGFIAVTPPANLYDFGFLAPCPASGLIIHGDADRIVPADDVEHLALRLQAQGGIEIDYQRINGGNHFFEKHMDALEKSIGDFITRRVAEIAEQAKAN